MLFARNSLKKTKKKQIGLSGDERVVLITQNVKKIALLNYI